MNVKTNDEREGLRNLDSVGGVAVDEGHVLFYDLRRLDIEFHVGTHVNFSCICICICISFEFEFEFLYFFRGKKGKGARRKSRRWWGWRTEEVASSWWWARLF